MSLTEDTGAPAIPWYSRLISPLGLLLAAAFFGASLTPSLIPRDPVMQGVLGGVLAAIGHEIGLAAGALWRFMQLPGPSQRRQGVLTLVAILIAAAIVTYCLMRAADWQNATRAVMDLPPVDTAHPLIIGQVAAPVFLALWLVMRLFVWLGRRAIRLLQRLLPPRIGTVLGWAAVLLLFWMVVDGVLLRRAFEAADASFEAADILIEPDIPRPEDPAKTGSDESLVVWEEMGRWGRSFVARAPTAAEIAEFAGPGAMDPVRVYIGRRSGDTAEERAQLALEELIRQGGFERAALLVMVPVGTGWMDPGGQDTLEFILGGYVATAAVQYSYLTSVLSLLAHPEYGVEQARALFDVIYDYWTDLPPETRPAFYVHGLSQGAFNSQRSLPFLDILGDPIQGALWAGSPFLSPVWQRVRDERAPDSPAWRPRFGNGSLARVTNQDGAFPGPNAPWGPMRFVFLHYPSDPIVAFTFASGIRRPDWMDAPRPPDIAPELGWFPLVTMFQNTLDMAISLQVPGFGHYYIAPDYIDAWAEVVAPEGWSPARAETLKAIFEQRPPAF